MADDGAIRLTGLRVVARLLVAAPQSPLDANEVANLLHAYQPQQLHRLDGVSPEVAAVVAERLGLTCETVEVPEPLEAFERLAAMVQGAVVAVLAPPAVVPVMLARALGAPAEMARRFASAPRAVSVLECDEEGRWSVVRVNEGAFPASR